MPIELKIPEVGESITEVQIAEWLKAEGDAVQTDEAVAVIDSEKTTFELPASASGTLVRILRQAGETVKVGEVIAHLEAGGEATEKSATSLAPTASERSKPGAGRTPLPAGQDAVPVAQADAKKNKAESPQGRGTGVEVREAAPETQSAPAETGVAAPARQEPDSKPASDAGPTAASPRAPEGDEEVAPMSMLRRTVARRLVEAKQQMAMLTTFNEVDMSTVKALRHEHQEAFVQRHGAKLGLMSFFVKAVVDALKQFPQLNAEVRANDIVYHNYFNIGVALATERGLVVPVLHNADRLSFADVEKAIGGFASRAKDRQLKPEELEGATFTITNGGVFGSLLSTPIISPPQSGILGMHTIQDRPIAVQGQVVIRPMMYLALTYDHRLVDGREAVLFLRRVKEAVESPARMLLEI